MPTHFVDKPKINSIRPATKGGPTLQSLTLGGPVELEEGEKIVRLEVWVWQDECACFAVQRKFPTKGEWGLETDPKRHVGAGFKADLPATAMALMVTRKVKDGKVVFETYQWTQGVFLVD
jgi:hypothetical protein